MSRPFSWLLLAVLWTLAMPPATRAGDSVGRWQQLTEHADFPKRYN
jgi:hypothetical protein